MKCPLQAFFFLHRMCISNYVMHSIKTQQKLKQTCRRCNYSCQITQQLSVREDSPGFQLSVLPSNNKAFQSTIMTILLLLNSFKQKKVTDIMFGWLLETKNIQDDLLAFLMFDSIYVFVRLMVENHHKNIALLLPYENTILARNQVKGKNIMIVQT